MKEKGILNTILIDRAALVTKSINLRLYSKASKTSSAVQTTFRVTGPLQRRKLLSHSSNTPVQGRESFSLYPRTPIPRTVIIAHYSKTPSRRYDCESTGMTTQRPCLKTIMNLSMGQSFPQMRHRALRRKNLQYVTYELVGRKTTLRQTLYQVRWSRYGPVDDTLKHEANIPTYFIIKY